MADVTINYKGTKVAELSANGTKTLKTSGKYCEGDVSVNYTKVPESEILGDTGFLSLSYIDVTIGANTVSLGDNAIHFLNKLANWKLCAAALLTNPNTQNQLIMAPGAMSSPSYASDSNTSTGRSFKFAYRYRDGAFQYYNLTQDYAFILKEGSKYRLWVCDLNTTNIKPY